MTTSPVLPQYRDPAADTDHTPVPSRTGVSATRLNLLRSGYLLIGVGLALVKWPDLVDHLASGPLMDGVVTCMLVAMSLLALLGLRYPVQLLPILLFEIGWKVIWIGFVAAPLWLSDRLDAATESVLFECVLVVVIVAVVPWRYVVAAYVRRPGDRWRSEARRG